MKNLLVGGERFEGTGAWVNYETIGGGQGARPGRDGMSGVHTGMTNTVDEGHQSAVGVPGQSGIHTNMTNTLNTPVEALEWAYLMRVPGYRLRGGSGGDEVARGGDSIERDLEVLTDATVSLITERRVNRPWGLAGEAPGATGENWLPPGGDESRVERLGDKCTIRVHAGDVIRVRTPGGGG